MKLKHLLLFKAVCYAAVALCILSLPFWAEIPDQEGLWIAGAVSLVFGFLAYRTARQIPEAGDDNIAAAYIPPADTPVAEQTAFYKRNIYLALVAFPALTWFIVSDLNDLESGAVESVRLWSPVAFLYEQFGYWVATLSVPVLGVVLVLSSWRKIARLNSEI